MAIYTRCSDGMALRCRSRKPGKMASVTLKNLKKVFDKNTMAVQDFSLKIKDKEFVVLVGPSGCGKSTTLRMVAGLEEITSGELYIGNDLVNNIAPKDRDIAMVFQNYALYPHMTVYENMAFGLKLHKVPKKEIERKVFEAAEILGINDYLKRRPKALSGGQRQRVAIGRAIVREPAVFLMDEPLSNLDAKLRNQMRAELIKLRQRINTTFIYVTHDQTEAMTLGDRIVIMKDGIIQQIGTPQQVFNEPINLFVAGFIGTPQMNFFPAELILSGGDYAVRFCGKDIPLPQRRQKALEMRRQKSGPVTLGVRPEHITTSEKGESLISAKLEVCELMGSEGYLHVNVEGNDTIIRIQVGDAAMPQLQAGNELHFTFPDTLIHLFGEDGNSIFA